MKWGLIPSWKNNSKNAKGLTSISLSSFEGKPVLVNALDKHCIVYVSGFYIWKNSAGGKIPYYITSKSRKLFGIAGMWESWETDDKTQDSFCLITKKPNGALSYFSNEIPAILKMEKESEWLASAPSELLNEENFTPEYEFEYYPVNQKIMKSLENNPKFIHRITYVVGEQTNLF
jgi:putative SOS response-associated peptidase YedK